MARAGPAAQVPEGILDGPGFRTVARTDEELSVVAPEAEITGMDIIDNGWTCFKLQGPFAFDETGIIHTISRPLAEADLGIFTVATYETDYILVKQKDAAAAADLWRADGHEVTAA